MKKRVFIGARVALMLFAFVACDNSNPTAGLSDLVTKIEVTSSVPSYFVGETPELEDYTVVATRMDGSTFTVSSEQLTAIGGGLTALAEEGENVAVGAATYVGAQYGEVTPVVLYADVYQMDKIVVSGVDNATYYGTALNFSTTAVEDRVSFRLSDYTVTAYDETEEFSRVLTTSEYAANVSESLKIGENKVVFTADSKFGTIPTETKNIMIYPDYLLNATVTTVPATTKEAVVNATAGDASDWVEVKGSYQSGLTKTLTSGYEAEWTDTAFKATSAFTAESEGITVKVDGLTGSYSATVVPVADYVKSFTVSAAGTASDYITTANVSFSASSVVWASNSSTAHADEEYVVLLNGATTPVQVPSQVTSGTYPVRVSLQGHEPSYVINVTIQRTAQPGGEG